MSKPSLANSLRVRAGHYPPIRIREFLTVYLIGIACWFMSMKLSIMLDFPLGLIVYPTIGILLTRFATKKFEHGALNWNWHATTVGDLAKAKLALMAGWPLMFPKLIWQLLVFRTL